MRNEQRTRPTRLLRDTLARTLAVAAALCAAALPAQADHGKHKDRDDRCERPYGGGIRVGGGGIVVSIGAPLCQPAPAREWIQGRWVERVERIWIAGREERVWVPAEYRTMRDHCGRTIQVLARPGHWEVQCVPGRYETIVHREWEPGRWETRWGRY